MITLARPRRGPTRRVLTAIGLVVAVTAAITGVALAGPGSPAQAAARTDAYIRDNPLDAGYEPDTVPLPFYESPDIAICNIASWCYPDQNPVPGNPSYVFAKVNVPGPYSNLPSKGHVDFRYTLLGGAAQWPTDWTWIGNSIDFTAYPGVTTVSVVWPNPPSGHFCIMARWISDTDPMAGEGPNSEQNAINNNNDAWHNLDTFPVPWDTTVQQPFAIGDVTDAPATNDLVFTEPKAHFEDAGGTITVDLGPLFDGWKQAGAKGEGIRPIGGTEVQILTPANARISGLVVNPGTKPQIALEFSAPKQSSEQFELDVDQQGPAVKGGPPTDLGGAAYDFTVTQPR